MEGISTTEGILSTIINVCIDVAWRLVAALVVLIVGRFIIKFFLKKMRNGKKYAELDPTVRTFLQNFIKIGSYVLLAVIIVGILGVPMASIITLFASAGAAIALAVKGAFSNLVGGIMLLIFKPISVGEFVDIGGKSGTVEEIGFFYTQLKTGDNLTVSVPNAKTTDSVIINYSRKDLRRLDLDIDVAYGSDIEKVKQVIEGVINEHEKALGDPVPFVRMTAMLDSSLQFTIRVWCERGDYGTLKSDLLEQLDAAFAKEGIEMPFPQLDVHLTK
ncbi:MAG: mechanosensitive ion channel [Ruminococcaceae bacterium]|nr:mechanosensitive ion channel [Oscillospiraceae bacterium]